MREAATPGQLTEVLEALRVRAIDGDAQAARTWLERVLGRPPEQPAEVSLELGDLSTAAGIASAMAAVAAAAAAGEVPLPAAQQVVGLLRATSDATVLADIEDRLRKIEEDRQ
ncbi:MAG: hypothetical protein KDC98_18835 [Planctomycetes bacterium]|nr:hypothetical protein [Planctomycetota bacterium]